MKIDSSKAVAIPLTLFLAVFIVFSANVMGAEPVRIVTLGDSLTAGYGLEGGEDFAAKLQEALIADGVAAQVDNAGVSGDTSAGGLARLDWAIQGKKKPDLVIVALGANDMLRGLNPVETRKNLTAILDKLKEKNIAVLLAGMKSPANMGPSYRDTFDKIYPDLAKAHNVALYPFFLQDVAMKADLNLPDGMHPNQKGIAIMVRNILPSVKKTLK